MIEPIANVVGGGGSGSVVELRTEHAMMRGVLLLLLLVIVMACEVVVLRERLVHHDVYAWDAERRWGVNQLNEKIFSSRYLLWHIVHFIRGP